MGGRAQLSLTALAVGAGVAMATSVTAAGDGGDSPQAADSQQASKRVLVTAQRTKRPIRGVVAAVQRGSRRAGTLFVSLHAVRPGASYRVDGNKATCDADGDVDGGDFLVWQRQVKAGKSSNDGVSRTRVALRAPLSETKSVRIYALPPGGAPVRRACISVDVWEHA